MVYTVPKLSWVSMYLWEGCCCFFPFFANNLNIPKICHNRDTWEMCPYNCSYFIFILFNNLEHVTMMPYTSYLRKKSEQKILRQMLRTFKDQTYKLPYSKPPYPITVPHLVEGPIQTWIWNQAPPCYKAACFFTITIPWRETALTF